jgi:lysophospholipase L1-like esterase
MNTTDTPSPDTPHRPAVECIRRDGLPRFFALLGSGADVVIAYFGGSITAAPGWRIESRERLSRRYPDARISEVNAAIGGTGSTLGAYRLRRDVISRKPDLVFIEFAVNDSGTDSAEIIRSVEGIVRMIRRTIPHTELCFVYTIAHETMLEELGRGALPRAASVMEAIADHYGIASINLGLEIARMSVAGRLVFKGSREEADAAIRSGGPLVFSQDGVHPFIDTGHRVYADVLERSLELIEGHTLPQPIAADNYEEARLVPIEAATRHGEWTRLVPETGSSGGEAGSPRPGQIAVGRMPSLHRASPGARLEFAFTGTCVGFYDFLGPDCGRLAVRIDDGPIELHSRFDAYCTYHRLGSFIAAAGLPAGRHSVTVTVETEPFDKRSILFEHNRGDYDASPSNYEELFWYVGDIMLVGIPE